MSDTHASRGSRGSRGLGKVTGVLAAIVAVTAGFLFMSALNKTAGGEIAVVRNGGPLDNNQVRQVVDPASSVTYTGLFSQVHKYPAQQRFYTITAAANSGDRGGVDVEHDPTSDGVEVGIEGTIYFTLTSNHDALSKFDDKYGTRTYVGADQSAHAAWDGDEGWNAFLDQIVRPVISNDLRQQIGDFRCEELQAACALVQSGATASTTTTPAAAALFSGKTGAQNNVNIQKIQNAINTSLEQDLNSTLGGPFITGVRFSLAHVTLPAKVQASIDDAQAEFAAVSKSQAKVAQAQADARANESRQEGYSKCPACASIDTLKAIPPTVTTFAPGAGFAITQPGK